MARRWIWLLPIAVAIAGCAGDNLVAEPPIDAPTAAPTTLSGSATPSATALPTPRPDVAATSTAVPTARPAPITTTIPFASDAQPVEVDLIGAAMVWTGDEIIFWGRSQGYGGTSALGFTGAAFDPATASWRDLAPAPNGSQSETSGFWTGQEVVFCCGRTGASPPRSTQLYNPTTDSWRSVPPPPFSTDVVGASAALSGELLYVVASDQLLVLDLATGEWSDLAPPPERISYSPAASFVAVADGDLVLWPRRSVRAVHRGLLYDAAADEWTQLPSPPVEAWPAMPDLAWTGQELFVVGGLPGSSGPPEQLVGARLDWDSMTWRALPDVWPQPVPFEGNLGSQSITWTGERLIVALGALGSGVDPIDSIVASYDPSTDQWFRLDAEPGIETWNPPLIAFGSQIALSTSTGVLITEPGWTSDESIPIRPTRLAAAPRPEFVDLLPRTNTPLTLVGSTGNGASIVVIDLELGLRTIYNNAEHSLGEGSLTNVTLVDRDLYVWRTFGPLVRFDGGPAPWDQRGDRMTFGELAQPATPLSTIAGDRIVYPIPGLDAAWMWGIFDGQRLVRLVPFDGSADLVTHEVDENNVLVGRSRDGAFVVSDLDGMSIALWPDGSSVELGAGQPVTVAGDELLLQDCDSDTCARRWVNLATGDERNAPTNEWRWSTVGGPSMPSLSPPIDAASPNGEQILVARRLASTPSTEYRGHNLVRVDVATGITAPLPVDDVQMSLAAWSRSGEQIALFDGAGDVVVVDIDAGTATTIANAVPEGFFVLAAG